MRRGDRRDEIEERADRREDTRAETRGGGYKQKSYSQIREDS